MRIAYLYSILFFNATITYCQNNARKPEVLDSSYINNQWNINKYLWSHTRSETVNVTKPLINFEAIDVWDGLWSKTPTFSRDGLYFVYGIQNNLTRKLDSVVIQSTTNWKKILPPKAISGFFSRDSKQYIFRDQERLCFLQIGQSEFYYEKNIESYKVDNNNEWLAYRLSTGENLLILRNLVTGKEKQYNQVISYFFNSTGNWLACQLKNKSVVLLNLNSAKEFFFEDVSTCNFDPSEKWFVCHTSGRSKNLLLYKLSVGKRHIFSSVSDWLFFHTGDYLLLKTDKSLEHVNLIYGKKKKIWLTDDTLSHIINYKFDGDGKQVGFVTGGRKAIWYWKEGIAKSVIKLDNQTPEINGDFLQDLVGFSGNGRYMRFILESVPVSMSKVIRESIQVEVWNYKDKMLQSTQRHIRETIKKRTGVLDIYTGKIVFIERENEILGKIEGDFAIMHKSGNEMHGDRFWGKGYYEDSVWLISLQNNIRRLLPVKKMYNNISFSPDGHYLIYYDVDNQGSYFSLDLATDKLINISKGIPAWELGLIRYNLRTSEKPLIGGGIKFWLKGGKGFLVYDNSGDIWELDPSGQRSPVNITNGLGKSNNISFNLIFVGGNNSLDGPFIGKDTLLLSAYNRTTKMHGFYRKHLVAKGDPELLSMDSCHMEWLYDGINGKYPLSVGQNQSWIVNRQNGTNAPNYYLTRDFKDFKQLTFLGLHKKYNWLKAEIHTFKQLDGSYSQGVLYKPENFDPAKKYPLIISFYETLSDRLYHYPPAEYITSNSIFSNPAWMVSHGYLVFIPDIHFIKDQWGPSTVNTIDGAAKYLADLSFVDSEHLGAVGHSNSGRFGYYLLTHSRSFAAMSLGSGFTGADVLSGALSLQLGDKQQSCLEVAEVTAYGTALGNIWENKDRWIDHIAPLQADKAISPLLLFHNKKDGDDVRLAIELFIAFWRLEKKAWWLQYDNGGHTVEGDDAKDWTIRYTQFFDHYLKEAPAPRWMTQGIPAKWKGIDTGYDLDPGGSCALKEADTCKICNKWNEQCKRTPEMFSKPLNEWHLGEVVSRQ